MNPQEFGPQIEQLQQRLARLQARKLSTRAAAHDLGEVLKELGRLAAQLPSTAAPAAVQPRETTRESDDPWRTAVAAGDLGTWDHDVLNERHFWSERCKALYGFPPDAPVTWDLLRTHIHPEDLARVDQVIRAAMAAPGSGRSELEFRTCWPDGTVHWLRSRGQTLFAGEGTKRRAVRRVGSLMDITAQKQVEAGLRQVADAERHFSEQLAALHEVTIALQQIDGFDALCRAAVELGRERLGFERLALWFCEGVEGLAGSFGTDLSGQTTDEHGLHYPAGQIGVIPQMRTGKLRSLLLPEAEFVNPRTQAVEHSTHLAAALWAGDRILGYLAADNLVRYDPVTPRNRQLLELYACTLGELCGRQRAEESLGRSERRFRALIEKTAEYILIADADGTVRYDKTKDPDPLGYPPEEFVGQNVFDLLRPEDVGRVRAQVRDLLARPGVTLRLELPARARDGSWRELEIDVTNLQDEPAVGGMVLNVRDITVRKQDEESLRRLNRQLRAISACNEALVRSTDEQALFEAVCRIMVEIGGYRMAWVGLAQADKKKRVLPVARAGREPGSLEEINVTWADDERGHGAVGAAIRTAQPQVVRDTRVDPRFAPWRELAITRGYGAVIAMPLLTNGKAFGALTLYSATAGDFAGEEVRLLTELTGNVAYGVAALRTRAERQATGVELEQHRRHLEEIVAQRTAELTLSNTRLQEEVAERKQAEERTRRHEQQLRSLASELTLAEDRERQNLTHLLHDDLQQWLAAAKAHLDVLRMESHDPETVKALGHISEMLAKSDAACRGLTADLCPPVLRQFGLASALQWLAERMHERYGLTVQVQAQDGASPQTHEMSVLLYQSVRELLFNVFKHARVKAARVQLNRLCKDRLRIVVSDRGAGFDPGAPPKVGLGVGFGLFSVRERLELMGGVCTIDSVPGQGTRVTLTVPIGAGQGASGGAGAPGE